MSSGLENKLSSGNRRPLYLAAVATAAVLLLGPNHAEAQLPGRIVEELRKLGQVVEPGCTAKLIRPMMPDNDYNTYWPVDAEEPNTKIRLYRGINLSRDVSFGPEPKDLIDIFTPDRRGSNRTVLIYVSGGAGNKIEQQAVEANAFYDNIGRWAAEEEMVGVILQRGGTAGNQGQNIALLIEWLKTNIAQYRGNPDRMFIWAHSAGNGPLGQYIGRPDLYGIGVKGAIFMSGNPVNFGGAAGGGRGERGATGGAAGRGGAPADGLARGAGAQGTPGQIGTSMCTNTAGPGSQAGVIRGPSSALPDQGKGAAARRAELAGTSPWRWTGREWVSTGVAAPPPPAAPAAGRGTPGAGARGARGRGGDQAGAAGAGQRGAGQATAQDLQIVGFLTTRTAIMLARAELDPGVNGGMLPSDIAIHDELCKLEGPKAKDGVGHCPTMLYLKGHSHMSEVFSIGSSDESVSGPILSWIKNVQ